MNSKFYDNKIFADNLRSLMEKKDISGAELARKMGISKSAVSDWLAGKSLPRIDKIDKMCFIFNCTREDFARKKEMAPADIETLKVALFGGADEVTPEMWKEVQDFAEYVKAKYQK